jgi:hypothetical protein
VLISANTRVRPERNRLGPNLFQARKKPGIENVPGFFLDIGITPLLTSHQRASKVRIIGDYVHRLSPVPPLWAV